METGKVKEIVEREIDAMNLIDKFIDDLDGLSDHFKRRLKEENQLMGSGRILNLVAQTLFPEGSDELSTKNLAKTCKKMVEIFVEEGFARDEALQLTGRLIMQPDVSVSRPLY